MKLSIRPLTTPPSETEATHKSTYVAQAFNAEGTKRAAVGSFRCSTSWGTTTLFASDAFDTAHVVDIASGSGGNSNVRCKEVITDLKNSNLSGDNGRTVWMKVGKLTGKPGEVVPIEGYSEDGRIVLSIPSKGEVRTKFPSGSPYR